MKMIKLSEDHYIVVDDIGIDHNLDLKKDDWCYRDTNIVLQVTQELLDYYSSIKSTSKHNAYKITHSTQPIEFGWGQEGRDFVSKKVYNKVKPLSLSEVKELVGEVDMAFERYPIIENDKEHNDRNYYRRSAYYQALEDNKDRKYTREDLLDAYTWGFLEGTERGDDVTDSVNKFSQSLQPKTEWDVEFVDGKLKLK